MKTRSGRFVGLWKAVERAAVERDTIRVDASFAHLLKASTDEESARCLDLGIDINSAEDADTMDDVDVLPDISVESPLSTPPSSPLSSPPPSPTALDTAPLPPLDVQSAAGQSSSGSAATQRSNERRKRKREDNIVSSGHRLPPLLYAQLMVIVDRVAVDVAASGFPTAKNAYTARTTAIINARTSYTPAVLDSMGLRGIPYVPRSLRPIVDRDNLVIGAFVDKPRSSTWDPALLEYHDLSCNLAEKAGLKTPVHKRGPFVAVNSGVLLPPGSQMASQMKLGPCGRIIQKLVGMEATRRMACFQSAAFELWAPRLHAHYHQAFQDILMHDHTLKPNWRKSVFPMAAFNLSRHCVCFRHRDVMNLPYGWCAVTALGRFDHRRSACIILWELGLYFEFPHGTTIYLPSASITHSNTRLADPQSETRSSFTQYFPGFLMRWRDNNFVTDKELKMRNPKRFKDLAKWKKGRWVMGLGMMSTLDEVLDRLRGSQDVDAPAEVEEPFYESEEE